MCDAPEVLPKAVGRHGDNHETGVAERRLGVMLGEKAGRKGHVGQAAGKLAGSAQFVGLAGGTAEQADGHAGASGEDGQGGAPGGCADDGGGQRVVIRCRVQNAHQWAGDREPPARIAPEIAG